MIDELEPCPFGDEHKVQIGMHKNTVWCTHDGCPLCFLHIGIKDWNTRPIQARTEAES